MRRGLEARHLGAGDGQIREVHPELPPCLPGPDKARPVPNFPPASPGPSASKAAAMFAAATGGVWESAAILPPVASALKTAPVLASIRRSWTELVSARRVRAPTTTTSAASRCPTLRASSGDARS